MCNCEARLFHHWSKEPIQYKWELEKKQFTDYNVQEVSASFSPCSSSDKNVKSNYSLINCGGKSVKAVVDVALQNDFLLYTNSRKCKKQTCIQCSCCAINSKIPLYHDQQTLISRFIRYKLFYCSFMFKSRNMISRLMKKLPKIKTLFYKERKGKNKKQTKILFLKDSIEIDRYRKKFFAIPLSLLYFTLLTMICLCLFTSVNANGDSFQQVEPKKPKTTSFDVMNLNKMLTHSSLGNSRKARYQSKCKYLLKHTQCIDLPYVPI